MVLGVGGSCSKLFLCDCPTVRVKEFFSTEAIFPDTDCSCEASWLLDKPRIAVTCVPDGGKDHTATARVRQTKVEKITRPTFLIIQPSSDFRPSLNSCAEDLPRLLRILENPISLTKYLAYADSLQ